MGLESWVWFAVAAVGSFGTYLYGQFPTQVAPKKLDYLEAKADKFKDDFPDFHVKRDDDKISAWFSVDSAEYPEPLVIRLGDLLAMPQGWHVVNAIGYSVNMDGVATELKSDQPIPGTGADGKPNRIVWNGLKNGRKYRLEILLHRGQSSMSPEEVIALLDARKILTATAYLRD